MRNFLTRRSQKEVFFPVVQTPLWRCYGAPYQLTFHGQDFKQAVLFDALSKEGALRLRGGSINESPFNTCHKGIVSRSEITSEADLLAHTERAIGISTTHVGLVAKRFSEDSGNAGVIHAFDQSLVPMEDKKFIPHFLKNSVIEEQETVFYKSLPEEVYVGYWDNFPLGCSFFANQNYIDPVILSADPLLQILFFDSIYKPFSIEVAPAIRKKTLTDFKEAHYEKGRKEFHHKYGFFAQGYLANKAALDGIKNHSLSGLADENRYPNA